MPDTPRPSLFKTALRLGRVSNVPTIWTNVLAGAALADAARDIYLPGMIVAMSVVES